MHAIICPSPSKRTQEKTLPPPSSALIQRKPAGSLSSLYNAGCDV